MRMPSRPMSGLLVLLVLCGISAPLTPAQDLAGLFPADTFLYLEGDARTLMKGGEKLELLRMFEEEEIQDFLAPGLDEWGVDLSKGVAGLIEKLPIQQFVQGRFAFGVSGLSIAFERPGGETARYEISPSKPVSARLFHEALGLFAAANNPAGQPVTPRVRIEPEIMATIEPGPALARMWEQLLESAGDDITREAVSIGGRECERISWEESERFGDGRISLAFAIYADTKGDTWTMASSPALMKRALNGGHQRTLAASDAFKNLRQRVSGPDRIAMAYVDIESIYGMVSTLVPPIVFEEIKILGLDSMEAMGFGLSYAAGGVRESIAFTLDGEPKGLLRLVNAAPRGLSSMESAPAASAGYFAMKFDASRFLKEVRGLASDLAPGSEQTLDAMLQRASSMMGLDLAEDLLPALGDEFAISVRASLPIPQVLATIKLGDVEKATKLMSFMGQIAESEGMRVREVDLRDDGPKGMSVRVSLPGGPGQTITMGLRQGHLVMSNSSIALRKHLKTMASDQPKNLARGSEVFTKVLAGLSDGEKDDLVALAFTDFRKVVAAGLPMLGMVGGEIEEIVDTTAMPDVATVNQYVSGLAIGVRRDEGGISIDMFSPLGVLPLGAAGAAYEMERRQQRQREWRRMMEAQQREARKAQQNGPFVGFRHQTDAGQRLKIQEVIPGTPGEKAGLQVGDVILSIDGHDIVSPQVFTATMKRYRPGDLVTLTVKRGEEGRVELKVTLGRRGDY